MSTLIVEGGAEVARSFFDGQIVDRIDLYEGSGTIGDDGIEAPIAPSRVPEGFELVETRHLGADLRRHYERIN